MSAYNAGDLGSIPGLGRSLEEGMAAVLAMKGMAAREELAECSNAIKKLGLKLEEVREFPIDGTNHAVIILRKVSPTPKQFPRRFAKIKQAPL